MKNVIGIINFHNSPELGHITENRPLGSTSFMGRYAFCDFALSSLCNAGITRVGLLVKDHQRSILKHIGSMDAWQTNTKLSQMSIMYNESAHLKPAFNTDINNIRENDWVIFDSNATHLVIVPVHIISSMNLDEIIDEHIRRKELISVVATEVEDISKEYIGQPILKLDKDGYVESFKINNGKQTGSALCSMSAIIINRTTLADICAVELQLEPKKSLRDLIVAYKKRRGIRVHVHRYEGFSRCIDSFEHYIQYSLEMLDYDNVRALFLSGKPVYTITHDTPPAIYSEGAVVKDSYIANGAIIEGTVEHCIIARDVKIGKGAKVKNSIIFSSVKIDAGAVVENALVDKYSIITNKHSFKGTKNEFAYAKQGAIL